MEQIFSKEYKSISANISELDDDNNDIDFSELDDNNDIDFSGSCKKGIRLVKRKYIEQVFDISRATIYRMMANDEFPHPVYLPGGGARWIWDEVMEWAEQRISARG